MGFGYALLEGPAVASWCLTVFASGQAREVGLATVEAYRGRGYATRVAAACLEQCLRAGCVPHWQCREDNLPSRAVAEKVGFVEPVVYGVLRIAL
jgi:RimJ/RimL family protein N-acetyltransferase